MMPRKELRSLSTCSSDIVKQGYLFVKRPPGNPWNKLKAWHKRFFILRDTGSEQGAELAMFNSQADSRINSPALGMVLRDTVHIGIASESHRFPNVLVVVFNGRSPLLLAAEDELTAKSWMLALDLTCQNASLKGGSTLSWQSFANNKAAYSTTSSSSASSSNCFPPTNSTAAKDTLFTNLNNNINNNNNNKLSSSSWSSNHPPEIRSPVPTTNSGSAESDSSGCSCAPAFVRESVKYGSDASSNNSQHSDNFSLTAGTLDDLTVNHGTSSSLSYTESDDFCLNNFISIGSPKERYSICFETTEASERVGLRGNLDLVVFARGIGIARKGDSECFLLWPISVIRQYRLESLDKHNRRKHSKGKLTLVTIEVGRRCLTGEGIFKFTSDQGHEIMRKLEKAVNNWALHKARLTSTRSMYHNNQHRLSLPRSCNHDFCQFTLEASSSINGNLHHQHHHHHRSAPTTPAMNKLNLMTTKSTSCSGRSSCYGGSLTWTSNANGGGDHSGKSLLKAAREHLRNSLNSIGTRESKLPKIDVNEDFGYVDYDSLSIQARAKSNTLLNSSVDEKGRSKSDSKIGIGDPDDCSYLEILPS